MHDAERSDVLRALAEPLRRRIIAELLPSGMNVGTIAQRVGVQQYQVSKHLLVLRKAKIVESVAAGKIRTYSIVPELRSGLLQKVPVLDFGWCTIQVDGFIRER